MTTRNNKKNTSRQSKYFCLLLYTEWDNLTPLIDRIISISKNYAYVIHNKDKMEDGTDKKTHIHFVIEMGAKRTINGLYQILADACVLFGANLIQICDNVNGAIRYLTHIDYPEKAKYEYNDIHTNNAEWLKSLYEIETDDLSAYKIIDTFINESTKELQMRDVIVYAISTNCYKYAKKSTYLIKQLIIDHNKQIDVQRFIENKITSETIKNFEKIKEENDITTKLLNTFDKVHFVDDDGNEYEIMCTNAKKGLKSNIKRNSVFDENEQTNLLDATIKGKENE